jgi:hypothetical protein
VNTRQVEIAKRVRCLSIHYGVLGLRYNYCWTISSLPELMHNQIKSINLSDELFPGKTQWSDKKNTMIRLRALAKSSSIQRQAKTERSTRVHIIMIVIIFSPYHSIMCINYCLTYIQAKACASARSGYKFGEQFW